MADITTSRPRLMPDQYGRLLLRAVPEPPIAHAYHHWDADARTLSYTYNNRRLLSIHIPGEVDVYFRHGADGHLQSLPLHQQVYVMITGGRATATVTFELSPDALSVRPRRAGREQATLGQVGRPLLPDVNGLYDIAQAQLIAWYGQPWHWLDTHLTPNDRGCLTARMAVALDSHVWTVTIKPHYYRTHLGYRYHRPWQWRPQSKAVAGWCTWEAYRRDVTEANVRAGAAFCAEHFRPYGLEYIQLDDGFEKLPLPANPHGTLTEAWLDTKDEFPGGHAGIVDAITRQRLEPGVWTTACIYNDAWADAQPEHLIKDEHGEVMLGDWVKYILDCSEEALDRHVRGYYRGLREAGYTYFKTDGIRHLIYDGLQEAVLHGLLTNDEAEHRFRRFLEIAREEIGPEPYFLSSWGVLTQGVGLVDACRIAQDAMPNWCGMQMQIVESARWFFTQRILWTNDPDHVCVRAPFEWSRSVLSLVSLSGGLFMLSDPIDRYDAARVRLVQQCLPPLTTATAETGHLDTSYAAFTWTKAHSFAVQKGQQDSLKTFAAAPDSDQEAFDMAGRWETLNDQHPFSSLWAFHFDTPVARWCVMGRFATLPLPAARVALDALSLDEHTVYVAMDFWRQQYLGRVRGGLDCPALPLGHCQVVALRARLDRPQLLGSSRHVSQDAVSVESQTWSGDTLTLGLLGVAGTTETYWVHVPAGWRLAAADGAGLTVSPGDPAADSDGDAALPLAVTFPAAAADTVRGTLRVSFVRG